ncbi:MAG: glycosyltransferase family 4 protein [Burkholderiaceae bacterium]|nr:glycosyltransferase family 4 protein [Burkholderiaceae bacterium]
MAVPPVGHSDVPVLARALDDPLMRIAVVANTSWYLYNFRLNLMCALQRAGHDVVAVGPSDAYAARIAEAGIAHRAVSFDGDGVNPVREIATVAALARTFRRADSELVLSFTPKGNIYSGLAAMAAGIRTIPNVSGLGRVFIRQSLLTSLVRGLYRITLARAPCVFFQNEDDKHAFVEARLVEESRALRIPGSGVDLERFTPMTLAGEEGITPVFVFLLVARLLWDKGVGEFVEAARVLRREYPQARFQLLGFLDVANPSAVPRDTVTQWVDEGLVEYLGSTDDVRPFLARADCVVLPSYREGVPRALLEAAAMRRPIITTDAPGCRDVVDDGVTGFLCRPRDAGDLAQKMRRMLMMSAGERERMGGLGREKIESLFDERIVIDAYVRAIARVVAE